MSFVALAVTAAILQTPAMPPVCADVKPHLADAAEGAKLRRLDRLPKAEGFLAVMRTENGCIRPAKISEERARPR